VGQFAKKSAKGQDGSCRTQCLECRSS